GRLGHEGAVFVIKVGGAAGPTNVFTVTGTRSNDLLGCDVDGGFDADGDGVPDFLGGAMGTDLPPPDGSGPGGRGSRGVSSGKDPSIIKGIDSDEIGDLFGFSASFNGPCDGTTPTVVVGAPRAKTTAGKETGRALLFDAKKGTKLLEIFGENKFDGLGVSVGGL